MLTSMVDANVLKQICDLVELQVLETAVGKRNVLHLLRFFNSHGRWWVVIFLVNCKYWWHCPCGDWARETFIWCFDNEKFKNKLNNWWSRKKDRLSYPNLTYQIKNGKKLGYAEELICASVLKAISPDINLRTYNNKKWQLLLYWGHKEPFSRERFHDCLYGIEQCIARCK